MKHPRFTIFRGKDGQYYFHLQARNGRIIFNSKGEGYTQKHNAEKGIEAVKWFSKFADSFDIESVFGYVGLGEIVYYHYFNLRSSNHEIIGGGETYTTKAGAKKGIKSVQRCSVAAVIVDKTKD